MENNVLKYAVYTKENGESKERVLITLNDSPHILALDVTEFDVDEQAAYSAAVEDAQAQFKETIRNIGLVNQYRYFKRSGLKFNG